MARARRRLGALVVVCLGILGVGAEARAAEGSSAPTASAARGHDLALVAAAGSMASPGAYGGAFLAGLRLELGEHFAGAVDLGYGLLGQAPAVQDRWWLIPSGAVVLRAGPARVDLGAGVGVGTASGYLSWSAYDARPFTPVWHHTVPAARAHLAVAFSLTRDLALFTRLDAASLAFAGPGASFADTTWLALWLGVEPRLL